MPPASLAPTWQPTREALRCDRCGAEDHREGYMADNGGAQMWCVPCWLRLAMEVIRGERRSAGVV
jgi:hypothetical protein